MKNFKKLIKEAYLGNPLNEGLEGTPQYYVKYTTQDGEKAKSGFMSKREAIKKEEALVNSGVKKSAVYKIQKNIDLNGKSYTIDTELDKEIDYRKDEKGKPINEDIVDDKAKIYWLQKLKNGEIDTLPDNPRMEYLRHAMRDQLAQDKEQLRRERGLEESLNEIKSGDVVVYNHDDHTVMRIEDDELGKRIYIRPNEESAILGKRDTFWVKPTDIETKEEFMDRMMKDQIEHDEETLRRERGDLSKSSSLIGRQGTRNFMDEAEDKINEVVRGDDFQFIEIKDLHFETDPDRLEDMKREFGAKMGGITNREKIDDAEYALRRFRKEINYGNGTSVDPFIPDSYDALTSKLVNGPHAKKRPKVSWNDRKYEEWIESVAAHGGVDHAYDMAQNAKQEQGLIDWVKKNRLGFGDVTALERIQYDIEALAESLNEITTSPVSGTKAGFIDSLDNRKYKLTKDVEGAQIGDFTNVTLPKGTIIYNIPGGVFADHFSLKNKYASRSSSDPQYFEKPTFSGISIKRTSDILTAIENNSNVIEESVNEGTCGYTPDGKPRSKPASPELMKDDINLNIDDKGNESKALDNEVNHMFESAVATFNKAMKPVDDMIRNNKKELEASNDILQAIAKMLGKSMEEDLDENLINKTKQLLQKIFGPKLDDDVVTILADEIKMILDKNPKLKDDPKKDIKIAQELVKDSDIFKDKDYKKLMKPRLGFMKEEEKEFNFNKMVKEALTPNYLK